MGGIYGRQLFTAAAAAGLLLGAACHSMLGFDDLEPRDGGVGGSAVGGGGGTAGGQPDGGGGAGNESFVGTWLSTSIVATSNDDPPVVLDISAWSMNQLMKLDPTGALLAASTGPDGTYVVSGVIEFSDGSATMRMNIEGEEFEIDIVTYDLTAGTFVGRTGETRVDLGDGVERTYTMDFEYSRVDPDPEAAVAPVVGCWFGLLGPVDDGGAPIFINVNSDSGAVTGEFLNPLIQSGGTLSGTFEGNVVTHTLAPSGSTCIDPMEVSGLVVDGLLSADFTHSPCVGTNADGQAILSLSTSQLDFGNPQPNKLLNPGVEDSTNNWEIWIEDPGVVTAELVADTTEKHGGASSLNLRITVPGNGQRITMNQYQLSVQAGEAGLFSFWAKAVPPRNAGMKVNHREPPWTNYGNREIAITDDWQQFYAIYQAPVDDPIAGFYVRLRDEVAGDVWFDDFQIIGYLPN